MRNPRFTPLLIAAMLVCGAAAYPWLPAEVPTHWNAAGQVDNTGGRLQLVLLMPLLAAAVAALRRVLPRIDPRRAAYELFPGTYHLYLNAVVLFLTIMQLAMIASALGWSVTVPRVALVGVGVLLAVLGNELGRVQPNWFVGIRTPWTLADTTVWRQTHRLGGRLFVGLGTLIAVCGLLLPLPVMFPLLLVAIFGVVGFVYGYSYLLWRRTA